MSDEPIAKLFEVYSGAVSQRIIYDLYDRVCNEHGKAGIPHKTEDVCIEVSSRLDALLEAAGKKPKGGKQND